jgi:hypothetical protein
MLALIGQDREEKEQAFTEIVFHWSLRNRFQRRLTPIGQESEENERVSTEVGSN